MRFAPANLRMEIARTRPLRRLVRVNTAPARPRILLRSIAVLRRFHHFKTTAWIVFYRGESPLSGMAACCPQDYGDSHYGIVMGGLVDNRGDRNMCVLVCRC